MTITPQQIEDALDMRLTGAFLVGTVNRLIQAGLLVEVVTGRDGRYLGVAGDTADSLTNFARESGDADASWSTIIDTLLRIAENNKHWEAPSEAELAAEQPTQEEVPDWPIESMMPRRPGRVIIPTPTTDGMDAEGDEECAVTDPEIGTWALDAEIDRIRVEQMNAIFASLSVFRDRLTEVEERIRHLDEQVSGNMDDVITRTDPLEARVAALEKRALSHVISGAGGTVVYPSGGGVGLWM